MYDNKKFSVIIVAAGSGKRLGNDIPKQYIKISGQPILHHTVGIFTSMPNVDKICVVINPEHEGLYTEAIKGIDNVEMCYGGKDRKDSVYKGLQHLSNLKNEDIILIHDAARPLLQISDVNNLIDCMSEYKAASLAYPISDSLSYCDTNNLPTETISRDNLWSIQTPQAFQYITIKNAHENCSNGQSYTDDTSIVRSQGIDVKFVKGSKSNFKITLFEDLELAEKLLSTKNSTDICTGLGYDVHAFDDEQSGITHTRICGVDIAHNRKLKGHSDADVGLHALTDAILGAIGEGDIGLHFPPSNMDFKNMDSAIFLEHAMALLRDKGGKLINADITIICERPKIGKYRDEIVKRIADILDMPTQRINIKATTSERLGFTGREEGIAAQTAVSVSLPTLT
ncbi:MAG: bifunctional 2-C-methyl-D-erythritol 4-phosphate cytidylyltransferase/2-C-methyl-D-erythritol 2,4-cyclodiphosphate synthase [Alphaproteobacteria bacterium]